MADDDQFTPIDVGILLLDAVAELHRRGFQRVRIQPGMSASGVHWRVEIAAPHSSDPADWQPALAYSTGMEFETWGTRVTAATTAADLADVVAENLRDAERGVDAAYVDWYARLMLEVHRYRTLPIAYADYFDTGRGWEIGWGTDVRVPEPPDVPSTPPSSRTEEP